MAKRFGRNQRRKLREQVASAERVMAAVKTTYHEIVQDNAALRARLRKSIEIDAEVLRDHSRDLWQARIEAHRDGFRDSLYVANAIDERRLYLERERDRFIEHVSRVMANSLARAIGDKWGK